MTRRAIVIRWTKVFHLHLLLDSESLGELCRQGTVLSLYTSSLMPVNWENENFF
jgi:hypothetical protein